MKTPTSVTRMLVVLSIFVVSSPAFSVTPEPEAKRAQQSIPDTEDAASVRARKRTDTLNHFGARVVGTYLVTRRPDDGPSRILNIFADGNLTSIQSTQFGGGALGGDWFSNQHGTWKRVGKYEIEATVLDLAYKSLTGEFLGAAIVHYHLQFDNTFQTVTGSMKGKIFSPGVDPQHPCETKPLAEFSDDFQAKRVTVGD